MHLQLTPIPAFEDNYFWLLHSETQALVVDPGEASVVLSVLERLHLKLDCILITHHHYDHVGGVVDLVERTHAKVYAPAEEPMPPAEMTRLRGGDTLEVLGVQLLVLAVPGHTRGHIAYFFAGSAAHDTPILFCGDTLFSGGCGRLFEGTAAQMLASIDALATLPEHTLVCCAHEYTLSNLRFARAVEPQNQALLAYEAQCVQKRAMQQPTLPSRMVVECAINPFMRTRHPQVMTAVQGYDRAAKTQVEVFAALRQWKNNF